MKKTIIITSLALLFLSSCEPLSKVSTRTSKSMDIYGSGVIQTPVLVDLDVKETKISASISVDNQISIYDAKEQAISEAMKKANADVLIEPKFDIEISDNMLNVTVTGFPATYKNFRSIKPEDIELLRTINIRTQKANVAEPLIIENDLRYFIR